MNYKKESQFTNNASKRVFEEVYTNEDMTENKVYGYSYRLNVPQMFANNPSQEKAISPRRVMCEPKSHIITLAVEYETINDDGDTMITQTPFMTFDFTSSNTFEEIIHDIVNNARLNDDDGNVYKLIYVYNKLTGILLIAAEKNVLTPVRFRFVCHDYEDYKEFWDLLNQIGNPFYCDQDDPDEYNENTTDLTDSYQLGGVWSREPLYVHATFSNSSKHYLCRTGDFWFKPSKYYYDNINQNDFEIFFTTDGTHKIIPRDAVKIIEICFILKQFARL